MKLLLFAGTTEGRLLAQKCTQLPGLDLAVCLATEYGKELLGDVAEQHTVIAERLSQDEMECLMRKEAYDLIVDATHPYATQVTANIQAAAETLRIDSLRLLREQSEEQNCQYYASVQEAADALRKTSGNILVATGSKELKAYTSIPNYAERSYIRVLPTLESIAACEELGFTHSHIIAMQGPFSLAFNKAVMEQCAIEWMVTKDGGDAGGFAAKMQAALEQGVEVLIVGRPLQETGFTFDEVVNEVVKRVGETA